MRNHLKITINTKYHPHIFLVLWIWTTIIFLIYYHFNTSTYLVSTPTYYWSPISAFGHNSDHSLITSIYLMHVHPVVYIIYVHSSRHLSCILDNLICLSFLPTTNHLLSHQSLIDLHFQNLQDLLIFLE